MFGGVTTLNLDSKGRLAIPAKHRDALLSQSEGRMKLTVDPGGCLLLYPLPEWMPVYERLKNLSGPQKAIGRHLLANAEDVEMDGAGRILVSPYQRQLVGLDKSVALVGVGNRFEVWDEARWAAQTAAVMALDPIKLEELMDGVVL
jgi:MraZ protein